MSVRVRVSSEALLILINMCNFIKNFLLIIWQLPQIIVGRLVLCFVGIDDVDLINGKLVVYSRVIRGGISLGGVIIMDIRYHDKKDIDEKHEWGHTLQSRYLGWFYLLVIGIPSILWAAFYKGDSLGYYTKFYTERWADKLGGVIR